MCTVSVIPPSTDRGLRVVVNRDERRTRSLAWGPELAQRGGVPVISPVDAESLGTWVAASAAGLVFVLLNLNRGETIVRRVPTTSRGHVIPALAGAHDCKEALDRLGALDVAQFGPFRLVITDGLALATGKWNGSRLVIDASTLTQPTIASSSSLGDDLVELPRRALFEDLLTQEVDPWRAQDRLHQHAWPDRRHLSVLMSRATARTVSRTVIVMDRDSAAMSYAPVLEGWIGPVTGAQVALRTALAAAG